MNDFRFGHIPHLAVVTGIKGRLEQRRDDGRHGAQTHIYVYVRSAGSPAILGKSGEKLLNQQVKSSDPLDRWLCAPTFQWVCHKTASNMHNHPPQSKGLHLVYL